MGRYKREREFFDSVYSHAGLTTEMPREEISRYLNPSSLPIYGRSFCFHLLGNIEGKKILDLGCGDGDNAVFLAKKGAKVVAIDLSKEAINLTTAKIKGNHVEEMVKVMHMNGERTTFRDGEFDCVLGNAVLHHLDLARIGNELHRILKTKGLAVFREPVIFNKTLAAVRKIIPYRPHAITPDERPLTGADVELLGEKFSKIDWWPFEAISRMHFLFSNRRVIKFLHKIDYTLFKTFPFAKRFASCAVIRCIK